jgi:hypothetical protein
MKKGLIFLIAVLMLVLMLPAYGSAGSGNTAVIQGVVIDKNANPIQRAKVTIMGTTKSARTDKNGLYRFDALPKGYTCKLAIKANHFNDKTNINATARQIDDPTSSPEIPTTTLPDCTGCPLIEPFMVYETVPANGVFNADVSTPNIKITFEVEVNASTVTASTIKVTDVTANKTVAGAFAVSGKIVTFTPTNTFTRGTTYKVDITSGVKSKDGKTQSENYASVFSIRKYDFFFGDIHSHSMYSNDAYEIQAKYPKMTPGTVTASVDSAKKRKLHFIASTDHAEMITTDTMKKPLDMTYETCNDLPANEVQNCDEWKNILADCDTANNAIKTDSSVPIVFPGFEYTRPSIGYDNKGNEVPYTYGGHKCVIFKNTDIIRNLKIKPFQKDDGDPYALWNYLKESDCITIPHHPARGQAPSGSESLKEKDMSTDWSGVPKTNVNKAYQTIMPLVEIYSVHGSSEDLINNDDKDDGNLQVPGFRKDRSVDSALKMWFTNHDPAYKLGIISSTDDHTSRPGNCLVEDSKAIVKEEGDFTGGLVAALASKKDAGEIFTALKTKKAYGTSGPFINMDVAVTVPEYGYTQYYMGDTISLSSPNHNIILRVEAKPGTGNNLGNITMLEVLKYTKNSATPVVTTIKDTNKANLPFTLTESTIFRVIAYHDYTNRYQWVPNSDGKGGSYVAVKTRERAWSSPVWVSVAPPPATPR